MMGFAKEGRKKEKKERRGKGFTLIELMIVIAIIAILAGFAISSYRGYITKAKLTRDMLPRIKACAEDIVTYCVSNPGDTGVNINSTTAPDCNKTIMSGISGTFDCNPDGTVKTSLTISNTTEGHVVSCTVNATGINCNVR